MNTVLFVNATIGFSENPFLVGNKQMVLITAKISAAIIIMTVTLIC